MREAGVNGMGTGGRPEQTDLEVGFAAEAIESERDDLCSNNTAQFNKQAEQSRGASEGVQTSPNSQRQQAAAGQENQAQTRMLAHTHGRPKDYAEHTGERSPCPLGQGSQPRCATWRCRRHKPGP
jgi:hypothetical protein